jgi:uncharacterized protein YndB with AHSA1/START domain
MAISFEHTVNVSKPPQRVFETLDDVAMTPKWLDRCTGIEKLSAGPNTVGTKLRYSYKDGGRRGQMDGEVTARAPGERLTMRYDDKMMEVVVDFRIAADSAGTRLTHAIAITPKTFFAKLFSPMIRRQLPKQTTTAMEKLKAMLESGA